MADIDITVHNERTKLTATYLNAMAVALVAVGGFAPMVTYVTAATPAASAIALFFLAVTCLVTSASLHWQARRVLKKLRS